jgi:hypothetical protein
MLITGPFAHILEADRARFNARFAEARHRRPDLDADAFAGLLRGTVTPIVEAVHAVEPDKTAEAAQALYNLALDLLAGDYLGPTSRHPFVTEAWGALLPRLARFIAEAPRAVAGSVTNAMHNLAQTPGARPREWATFMMGAAEDCANSVTLLKLGEVFAWRAGMAHYRHDALEICALIAGKEPALACLALGLSEEAASSITTIIERLRDDPWLRPEAAAHSPMPSPELRLVARVGAFRGFGGQFLAPPTIGAAEGNLIVTDGESRWQLCADVFGATLHRTDLKPQKRKAASSDFQADVTGAVWKGNRKQVFPELAHLTSAAGTPTTLAATTSLSHSIFLVALTAPE